MKHTLAAVLACVFAVAARAQPPTPVSPPTPQPPVVILNPNVGSQVFPVGPPPALPSLNVVLPGPTPSPGPPIAPGGPGYYKSGGVVVGANGAYPYDSGVYLLGGMDGLARVHGTFTMVSRPGGRGDGCEGGNGGFVAGRCRSCSFSHPYGR